MGDSGYPSQPLIDLSLKSAYVLVRNIDVKKSQGQSLKIVFNSATHNRISEASVTQNSFSSNRYQGTIFMENRGVNDAMFWVGSNVVTHNLGDDSSNTITIVNASLHMLDNFIYNNSAGHVLQLGGSERITTLPQTCEENTFWLNKPHSGFTKQTIILKAQMVEFHNNVINNPTADVELVSSEMKTENYSLNCSNNWWGSGRQSVAASKILDGRLLEGFANVIIDPIHENPQPSFSISSKYCICGVSRYTQRKYFIGID